MTLVRQCNIAIQALCYTFPIFYHRFMRGCGGVEKDSVGISSDRHAQTEMQPFS
jgi:hypothetical protein